MRKIRVKEAMAKYEAPNIRPRIMKMSQRMIPSMTIPGAEQRNLTDLLAIIAVIASFPLLEIPDRQEHQDEKDQKGDDVHEAHYLFLEHKHVHDLGGQEICPSQNNDREPGK
jgi:hypothetical protein